jgi:hypothetical protein
MRYVISVAAGIGLATSVAVAADVPPAPVEGRILQLNKPGAIDFEISVGSGDGLKAGDVLASRLAKGQTDRKSEACQG